MVSTPCVNYLSYDEFLFAVRGELNERRSQVVLEAFEAMDKDKSGAVNASDLKVRSKSRARSWYVVYICTVGFPSMMDVVYWGPPSVAEGSFQANHHRVARENARLISSASW